MIHHRRDSSCGNRRDSLSCGNLYDLSCGHSKGIKVDVGTRKSRMVRELSMHYLLEKMFNVQVMSPGNYLSSKIQIILPVK